MLTAISGQALAGKAASCAVMAAWRAAQGEEADPAVAEFGQVGLGGELGAEDEQGRVVADDLVPMAGAARVSSLSYSRDVRAAATPGTKAPLSMPSKLARAGW